MRLAQFLTAIVAFVSIGCVEKRSTDDEIAAALANRSAPTRPKPLPMPAPGMLLALMAGQGAGPIRLGANVTQVERLMMHPCEVRSENLCRYVMRGIDFNLVGGITQSIYVQRAGRPAGKNANGEDQEFGFFTGAIPPDLRLGMTPEAIQEYLGKPYRAEKAPEPNPQSTVWRHYYPGMIIEYDRWQETGKLILGGVRIVKDPNAVPPGAVDAGVRAVDAGAPVDAGTDAGPRPPVRDAGPPRVQFEPR